jgi:hypothetical protein
MVMVGCGREEIREIVPEAEKRETETEVRRIRINGGSAIPAGMDGLSGRCGCANMR